MRSYQAGQKRYLFFCSAARRPAIPTSEETLMMFASYLAKGGLSHQTIKVYLSAVRNLHVTKGQHLDYTAALTPRLEMVLKGIKKDSAHHNPPQIRLPITVNIMQSIRRILAMSPEDHNSIMIWAACSLAFSGFLRSSEFTVPSQSEYDPASHLSPSDVSLDNPLQPSLIYVTIKQSKTDPYRKGATICLARTASNLCPVLALLPYLVLRGSQPGPLFVMQDSAFLTRSKFTARLREILREAGIDDSKYASHSFRSGAATTAAEVGISETHIKMLGRWESDAYQVYVKTPPKKLAELSKRLVENVNSGSSRQLADN